MMKQLILVAAGLCCVTAGAAEARPRHHHYRHHRYGVVRTRRSGYPVTIGYGDTIISGKTGFHRSDFGVMVPDGTSPNFVLSGRRQGSGLGANGLPGSNIDE